MKSLKKSQNYKNAVLNEIELLKELQGGYGIVELFDVIDDEE